MTVLALQKRLKSMGEDPGPLDGFYGPSTERAINRALDRVPGAPSVVAPPVIIAAAVPAEWMPWARMERIICHWTGGTYKANKADLSHYHILIEGDGRLVRGDHSITDNQAPIKPSDYASHTRNCNTGSIGVSLCCMGGKDVRETPFVPGKWPMARVQWEMLHRVVADLAKRYSIPVTRGTVLSHAEVQQTLGITQRGKWDYTRLAFDPEIRGSLEIGNRLRAGVLALL